jgi:hypothetical protein
MCLFRAFPGIFLTLASVSAMAAPEDNAAQNRRQAAAQALADVCAKVACRKSTRTITLRTKDGREELDTAPIPYLDPEGNLLIYPGETITIAFSKDGSGKARLLKVSDPSGQTDFGSLAAPEASVEFRFQQLDGKPDMVLNVQNATSAMIKYDAVQFVVGAQGFQPSPTSSCPVFPPGRGQTTFGGIEHWPYPIADLLIQNIRPLSATADRACK